MRTLLPLVGAVLVVFMIVTTGYFVLILGAAVGSIIESIIRSVPGFLYHLPSNCVAVLAWMTSMFWTSVTHPLHTLCVILGTLLVITYVRAMLGHFDVEASVIRGSAIRDANDVFSDFGDMDGDIERPAFRGSSVTNAEDLFNPPSESFWSRRWRLLKNLFTRTSAGDDLL